MAGSLILDASGTPISAAPTSSPVPMRDSLRAAVLGAGREGFGNGFMQAMFSSQLALVAYRCSGLLRKVVRLPAHDRVREWRDWQADEEQIRALEAEEARLGIVAKVKQAEVLRGTGGGALILVTAGDHDQPLPERLPAGGLVAVNVVSRRQLTLVDIDRELTSPTYGMPQFFQVGDSQTKIHPSRVVCFRGDPHPDDLVGLSEDDRFWGDCKLDQVYRDVQRSDETTGWFAALVRKAKLLRIGIPNLTDYTATDAGQAKLNSRVALIAQGESILDATVYSAASGADAPGEVIQDYQVTWNGIPAMMDAFDQRVAAVANIPFTVLMGRSPAGMNATGDHDRQNWNREVVSGQKLELRPCLDQLDKALIPSAGVPIDKVTWRFAPLETPTEAEEAGVFKTTMEAVEKLRADNSIPEVALNKAVQNLMSEREWLPGLDQALAEIPEAERFGLNAPDDGGDDDPSAMQSEGGGPRLADAPSGEDGSQTARRRAANDKAGEE